MRDIYPVVFTKETVEIPGPVYVKHKDIPHKWIMNVFPHSPGFITFSMDKRPTLLHRFWTRVFFGWKWVPIKEKAHEQTCR